jgi:hypothetical protein
VNPLSTPVTPAELFTTSLTDGGDQLKDVLVVAVPGIIGVGAIFWAGRLVLRKLGFSGRVAKI